MRVPLPSFVHHATIDPSTSPTTELGSRGAHKQKSAVRTARKVSTALRMTQHCVGDVCFCRLGCLVAPPALAASVGRTPRPSELRGGLENKAEGGGRQGSGNLPVTSTMVAVWQSEFCPSVVELHRLSAQQFEARNKDKRQARGGLMSVNWGREKGSGPRRLGRPAGGVWGARGKTYIQPGARARRRTCRLGKAAGGTGESAEARRKAGRNIRTRLV